MKIRLLDYSPPKNLDTLSELHISILKDVDFEENLKQTAAGLDCFNMGFFEVKFNPPLPRNVVKDILDKSKLGKNLICGDTCADIIGKILNVLQNTFGHLQSPTQKITYRSLHNESFIQLEEYYQKEKEAKQNAPGFFTPVVDTVYSAASNVSAYLSSTFKLSK